MYLKEITIYRNTEDNFVLLQDEQVVELTADMIPLVCDELARLKHQAQEEAEESE